jgi:hypothetical protein
VFTTTILTLALMTQAPAPKVERPTQPPQRMTQRERIAAKKAALRRQNAMREQAEYVAAQREQARAAAEYKAMLPFMLEQQRQAIQRQGDIERNQALERLARAAESEAQTYQWNSYYRHRP